MVDYYSAYNLEPPTRKQELIPAVEPTREDYYARYGLEPPTRIEEEVEEAEPTEVEKGFALPGIAGWAQSAGMGLSRDVMRLYNYLATHPLLKVPYTKRGLPTLPEPELERAPHPTFARLVGAVAPALTPAIGEEALAARAVPLAARVGIKPVIGKTAARATYGAGFMAGLEEIFGDKEDENRVKKAAIAGALVNVIPRIILSTVPHGLRAVVNHYMKLAEKKGDILTPHEADAVLGGIHNEDVLSFGDLVKSPWLRSLYHGFLSKLPFSGIKEQQAQAISRLDKDSAKLAEDLLHGEPTGKNYEVRRTIMGEIRKNAFKVREKTNDIYNKLYKKAQELNIKFFPETIRSLRSELSTEARESGRMLSEYLTPAQNRMMNILDPEKKIKMRDFIADIEELPSNIATQIKDTIKDTKELTFKGLNLLKSHIGKNYWNKIGTSEGRVWGKIFDSLNQDVIRAAEKSGAKEIIPLKNAADKFYKEEYVPFFKEERIQKIVGKRLSSTTEDLENTLGNDLYEKVLNSLSDRGKNRLLRLKLEGKADTPLKYTTEHILDEYNKLSPYEKDFFVTEKAKKSLGDLKERHDLLEPAIKASKTNILDAIRKLGHIRHGAYMAGAGYAAYRTHSPLLSAILIGAAPLSARLLKSRRLMEAYAGRRPVPFARLPKMAPVVERFARAPILAALEETEGER